jgi:hypothetical protein
LRACFIPLPRPGFTLQGFQSAAQPLHLIDEALPSCRSCQATCCRLLRRTSLPTPAFRALIQAATSKPLGRWIRPTELRSLPVFSLLRAFLRAPWNRLHGPSAHDLRGECSLCTRPLVPSVSISARPDDPSLDHPPVRDFQPGFQPDRSRTVQSWLVCLTSCFSR